LHLLSLASFDWLFFARILSIKRLRTFFFVACRYGVGRRKNIVFYKMKRKFISMTIICGVILCGAFLTSCGEGESSGNDDKGKPNIPEEPDLKPEEDIFLQYCIEKFDTDGNGAVSQQEADRVRSIDCSNMNITVLTDIDKFTNLEMLDCSYNGLTLLDLSNNHRITSVDCSHNSLNELVLTGCTELETLDCSYNDLTVLDASECLKLSTLDCTNNPNLKELWLLNALHMIVNLDKDDDTDVVYHAYSVGDLYSQNGKEGIVFWITDNGRHGKIASLEGEYDHDQWSTEGNESEDYVGVETGATDENDGMANMKKIQSIPGWHEKYPAFAWCADKGDGWYLPALNELKTMYETIGFDSEDWYWSSTEIDCNHAWTMCIYNGEPENTDKGSRDNLRAVCAF